jgi:hypothetical protein
MILRSAPLLCEENLAISGPVVSSARIWKANGLRQPSSVLAQRFEEYRRDQGLVYEGNCGADEAGVGTIGLYEVTN